MELDTLTIVCLRNEAFLILAKFWIDPSFASASAFWWLKISTSQTCLHFSITQGDPPSQSQILVLPSEAFGYAVKVRPKGEGGMAAKQDGRHSRVRWEGGEAAVFKRMEHRIPLMCSTSRGPFQGTKGGWTVSSQNLTSPLSSSTPFPTWHISAPERRYRKCPSPQKRTDLD